MFCCMSNAPAHQLIAGPQEWDASEGARERERERVKRLAAEQALQAEAAALQARLAAAVEAAAAQPTLAQEAAAEEAAGISGKRPRGSTRPAYSPLCGTCPRNGTDLGVCRRNCAQPLSQATSLLGGPDRHGVLEAKIWLCWRLPQQLRSLQTPSAVLLTRHQQKTMWGPSAGGLLVFSTLQWQMPATPRAAAPYLAQAGMRSRCKHSIHARLAAAKTALLALHYDGASAWQRHGRCCSGEAWDR